MEMLFTKFNGFNKRCFSILLLAFCLLSSVTFAEGIADVTKEPNIPPKVITGTINDQNGVSLPGVSVQVRLLEPLLMLTENLRLVSLREAMCL
jgi:hypothetical protein